MNKHSHCSLVYIKEKCNLILGGKRLSFLPGDLILLGKNKCDNLVTDNSGLCLSFSSELLYEHIYSGCNGVIKTKTYRDEYIFVRNGNNDFIHKIFTEANHMADYHVKKHAIYLLLSYFHVHHDFFPFFLSLYSIKHKTSGIIKTDIKHKWRLQEIARELCLCVSAVKKHLQQENTTFIKILTECRMEQAARLLSINDKNVNTVSAECGYTNVSYFIKVFTCYYGVSPRKYAQKHAFYKQSDSDE
ncbi:putative HTH-type transcriptional regulator GadX [Escherichia coli TA249]|uniref:helix-turn-helix domain-containing protein n=1 Tax=Escherichia coli TaxID=562 RepID=UPI000A187E78|nr:helix-turn-helix domain-containing protein [Escherichia coli]OSL82215.1 putative HTH-type transcriptional regulator GadX [Escherichia coli TA249]